MDKYKSQLIFKEYKVEKIEFERNKNYRGKGVKVELNIDKSIEYVDKTMNVYLTVRLFDKKEKDYPFRMIVTVKGVFEIEDNSENINFEPNAIAILYPYIRAIISTYTSVANVTPLILPTINVNKLAKDQEKN